MTSRTGVSSSIPAPRLIQKRIDLSQGTSNACTPGICWKHWQRVLATVWLCQVAKVHCCMRQVPSGWKLLQLLLRLQLQLRESWPKVKGAMLKTQQLPFDTDWFMTVSLSLPFLKQSPSIWTSGHCSFYLPIIYICQTTIGSAGHYKKWAELATNSCYPMILEDSGVLNSFSFRNLGTENTYIIPGSFTGSTSPTSRSSEPTHTTVPHSMQSIGHDLRNWKLGESIVGMKLKEDKGIGIDDIFNIHKYIYIYIYTYIYIHTYIYIYIYIYICIHLEPFDDPCFAWERPCFVRLTFKNRGHLGSRYIYKYIQYKDMNDIYTQK